jgi:hypothetical protein
LSSLLAGGAMAQRGGGGSRGGGGGGFRGSSGGGGFRGSSGGGGFRGSSGGGSFRGSSGGGGFRGSSGCGSFRGSTGGGFRGSGGGGFVGNFGHSGGGFVGNFGRGGFVGNFGRGYGYGSRGYGYRGYGFGFGGYWGGYYPYYGLGFGYWPDSYDYSYPYNYYGAYDYPAYASSPNVTVVYPNQYAQPVNNAIYVDRAHPVSHDYDQYGQEVHPSGSYNSPQSASAVAPSGSPVYLIAMKDGVIRAAASYWVNGNTLHYVTMEHDERQTPLESIDRNLSDQLNRERHVQFQLPR